MESAVGSIDGSYWWMSFVYLFVNAYANCSIDTRRRLSRHRRRHRIAAFAPAMSSLQDLEVLLDYSTQPGWPNVKQALDNWAIASKFTYNTERKKPDRARYICRIAGCPWVVNVFKDTDGMLEIQVTNRQHTCFRAALLKWQSFSKKE
jgi:hypothetical protein